MSGSSNPGFVTRLQNWVLYPVTNQMDMLDVVLSTVLVVTIAFAWIIILRHITEDV
jgi:hypothetical protein